MSDPSERFGELARQDATVAPLARLLATIFRSAAAPFWVDSVPFLQRDRADGGTPLLHGARLSVEEGRVLSLLRELAAVAEQERVSGATKLREALGSPRAPTRLDPLDVLHAALVADRETLERLAEEVGVEEALVGTIGHLATLPLLLAIGRAAVTVLEPVRWHAGFCPLCAAWPLLSEWRGLERRRWLRCGRCALAWSFSNQQCAFCDNRDHRTLSYLSPEGQHEVQQATSCDRCHKYLKGFAVIAPLSAEQLALKDLRSVELDIAALERGYTRPATLGFPLNLQVEAVPQRFGWLPWGR